MKTRQTFTGVDLLAVLCCTGVILVCTGMVGQTGRERAKRVVCMTNLMHLIVAWNGYADDHEGEIVNGDAGEYATNITKGPNWVKRDWVQGMTPSAKETAIREGALFPYVRDLKIYHCPLASSTETRSYSIVDSMNVHSWSGTMQTVKQRTEIKDPAARCVFLDDRGNVGNSWGGWSISADRQSWWDPPPIRHVGGTTLSFVDGHVKYWKWEDERTVLFGQTGMAVFETQADNPDIRRCQIAVWGDKGGTMNP